MLRTLKTVNALMGTEAVFLGSVITHWDNLELSKNVLQFRLIPVINKNGGRVLQTRIPMDNRLDTLEPGAGTHGAKAYDALAEEVLRYAK